VTQVLIVDTHPDSKKQHVMSQGLVQCLENMPEVTTRLHQTLWSNDEASHANLQADVLIYFPPVHPKLGTLDLAQSKDILYAAAQANIGHAIVISSAEIYGPRPHNIGYLPETRPRTYSGKNAIAKQWIALEEIAESAFKKAKLTLLRPAPVLVPNGNTYFSRLLGGGLSVTLPGHDPLLQLLSPKDWVEAICLAIQKSAGGIYNVAPDGAIPLRKALKMARTRRLTAPKFLQGLVRRRPVDQLDFVRYAWTVSNQKIKTEWGFKPQHTSAEALCDFAEQQNGKPTLLPNSLDFDAYGLDKKYVEAYRRTLFPFLRYAYWRIEHTGIENIPSKGRAVLTGVHRGLMPLDAVITFLLVVTERHRYTRFLIHPTLIKFPFQFNFMTKLGGMIACQENADYVLERDEVLGMYPEGIHGAFTYYRDAYKLGKFGRDEYVKIALRNQAPIVPFVTAGTPEIFPIFAKLNWRWWKRFSLWPCFPIAPPFPFLPIPLPSKWHVQFLEPVHIEKQYGPEAADDPAIVKEISQDIQMRMQTALDDMVKRRKHIFWGSIFKETTA
jgi:1-acyl-sn-glycerol-3-phosphate acyltransferase/nucleoside-diphosphate-sugar epimerase